MNTARKVTTIFLCVVLLCVSLLTPMLVLSVSYPCEGFVNGSNVRMRSGAGTEHSIVTVTVNGQSLTVTGEKMSKQNEKWYSVILSSGESGYIHSDYVSVKQNNDSLGKTGTILGSVANVRSAPGTWNSLVVVLSGSTKVEVHGTALDSDGDLWYHITAVVGGKTYTGYVFNTLLQVDYEYTYDKAFEEYLSEQGFPESYKQKLRSVHAQYPNWIFVADHLDISWDRALELESKLGVSLVQGYEAWRTMKAGAYFWDKGTYKSFDSGNWYSAHEDVVAYYLDPRNFLNANEIFQFVGMSYDKDLHTKDKLQQILNGTFMEGEFPEKESGYETWADIIMDASQKYGMSPYALASMILLEQGSNGSGASISGESGYYNFLNIGAYESGGNSAVQNGIIFASSGTTYSRPWNTRTKSILGGTDYYVQQYIAYGQNTLYYKKFNVIFDPYATHQYMTNIQGAYGEAASTKKAYTSMLDKALVFKIPVYSGIPDTVAAYPTTVGNNNYYLGDITINGYNLNPTFNLYNNEYELIVDGTVKEIVISATAKDANATVTGTGVHNLKVGMNEIKITVTATSSRTNTYTIYIERGEYNEDDKPEFNKEKYKLSGDYMVSIPPSLDIEEFKNSLEVKNATVHLLDSNGKEKSGIVATGDTVCFKLSDSSVYAEYTAVVTGDVSGDGKISLLDLSKVQRVLLKADTLTGAFEKAADVSDDARISLLDLSKIQRHLLKIDIIGG